MFYLLLSICMSAVLHLTILFGIAHFRGFDFFFQVPKTVIEIYLTEDSRPDFKRMQVPPSPVPGKATKHGVTEEDGASDDLSTKDLHHHTASLAAKEYEHTDLMELNSGEPLSSGETEQEPMTIPGEHSRAHSPPKPAGSNHSSHINTYKREEFHFDLFWLNIYVGNASLEAVTINNAVRITSQVHSAPVISSLYRVEDFAESWVIDGIPFNFRIRQQEGNYRSNKETIFDAQNRKITFFNFINGIKSEHHIRDAVPWDVISGFYYLRSQPLEAGNPVYIDIFDSNRLAKVKVDIIRKETITIADKGEISTIVVKPELQTEGLFRREGDMFIWLTDDERRIPVKVETKVRLGKVVAELRDLEVK